VGTAPGPGPDFTLSLRDALPNGRVPFESPREGPATLLLLGLGGVGAVSIRVNGTMPVSVELLAPAGPGEGAPGGLPGAPDAASVPGRGGADRALVVARLNSGSNEVEVGETAGVQVVRVAGTDRWFVSSSLSAGSPLFRLDLAALTRPATGLAAQIHYGPTWASCLWFSGCWGQHSGEAPAQGFSAVQGTSGTDVATLSYTLEDPGRGLVMPTRLTFQPDPVTGVFTVRVQQTLRATQATNCDDSLEFLQVRVTEDGTRDWGDGTVDYAWYRSQVGDCPDAAPGGRTGMVRIATPTRLAPPGGRSAAGLPVVARPGVRGPAAAVPLGATNTIGGYFAKAGVGSCGWVFHRYRANFRDDLTPVYSRCGPGAGTHFHAACAELFGAMALGPGYWIEAEYSLTMLPCVVTREEIEDLNEADLRFFGTEKEQTAAVAGWFGTKTAVGLLRSDGSLILLGLGREPGRVPVPAGTVNKAVSVYRIFDLVDPTYDQLDLKGGTAEVRPGWITVIDCGAALWQPVPVLDWMSGYYPNAAAPLTAEPEAQAGEGAEVGGDAWPTPPGGDPVKGLLMRK
jgi:hypothetical protein